MQGIKLAGLGLLLTAVLVNAEPTVIQITDKVVVKDTVRLGINLGSDTYYSGAVLTKKRSVENFEGVLLRQCHLGPISAEDGVSTWFGGKYGDWDKFALSNEVVLLSGPQQWERRKVIEVTERDFTHKEKQTKCRFFRLDKPIIPIEPGGGFMILGDRPEVGHAQGLHHHWNSTSNQIVHGDVRPGGFGVSALCLKGSELKSHYRLSTHSQRHGELNGIWKVRFWAKSVDANAELKVIGQADRLIFGDKVDVPSKWTSFERSIVVSGISEPLDGERGTQLTFILQSETADILIDDIEVWLEGGTNPTAFRDDCVATLKKYNPGILRMLQMGGSTIDNMLSPQLRMRAYGSQQGIKNLPFSSANKHDYSLPQFYELCEEVGAEPWYCLPGTILPEELEQFLEYVAGPTSSKYGKKREADGHTKPWTETFSNIHVEFGNEAWNNASAYQCGGFNGPDYWRDLIAQAKASSNYRSNIVFHAAGQAAHTYRNKGLLEKTPNADQFSIAPYIIHNLKKEDMAAWKDDNDFFRWAFAWPIDRSLSPEGSMVVNGELARNAEVELSVYEVNHHITSGDGPLAPRNKLVASLGGGLNVCNGMLLMLREQGVRNQCLFSLIQDHYRASIGNVKLWGTALNMRKGHRRYRPTFLAGELANKVIGGDLVKTVQSTNQPMFTATGRFENKKPGQSHTFPAIWSYAFKDGNSRGLILFNLDTVKANPVKVEFQGRVQGDVVQYMLSADKIDANNEDENSESQVKISETKLDKFKSGSIIQLPPHSMEVLSWTVK